MLSGTGKRSQVHCLSRYVFDAFSAPQDLSQEKRLDDLCLCEGTLGLGLSFRSYDYRSLMMSRGGLSTVHRTRDPDLCEKENK